MAGRRATELNNAIKRIKSELGLRNKAEIIGFIAAGGDGLPGWMQSKCRRIIAKAEKKAEKEAGF